MCLKFHIIDPNVIEFLIRFRRFRNPPVTGRDSPWQPVTVPHLGLRIATETLDFSAIVVPRCSKLALLGFVFGSFCFRRLWWLWWSSFIFNRLAFYTNANWLIHALQLCSFFSFFWTPTNQVPWPWYHFITRSKKVKAGISIAHCPLKTKPSIACLVNIVAQIQKGFLSCLFFFFSL